MRKAPHKYPMQLTEISIVYRHITLCFAQIYINACNNRENFSVSKLVFWS